MTTLRDRLLGHDPAQAGGGVSIDGPPDDGAPEASAVAGSPARAPAPGSAPMERLAKSFTPRRIEIEALSPIDQLKVDLHRRLVERLNLEALEEIEDPAVLATQIRGVVAELLRDEPTPLTQVERDDVIEQIVYEVTGLGPIEPFFRDPTISDILVNGAKDIYIERRGKLSRVPVSFRNDAHLMAIIDRIVSRVGRRVDESSPMVDARLPDGSRVNAIIPPLALDGPVLSIRRFGAELSMDQLVAKGSLTQEMVDLLAACVQARLNIIISGGTGIGQDDAAERAERVHSRHRARRHDRGRRRTAAAAGTRGAPGDAAAQHRRTRRGGGPRPGAQRPAHAARPHHRGRSARRRGAGHAAGDEHRSRGLAHHGARELPPRRAGPRRDDDPVRRHGAAHSRHPRADRVGARGGRADVAACRMARGASRRSPRSRPWKAT